MNHIGSYDGYPVYQLDYREPLDREKNAILVDTDGDMYYKGVQIGHLNPRSYAVERYDMDLYTQYAKREKSKPKPQEKKKTEKKREVPVPTCVAESMPVGQDGSMNGTDEFFARVAKEIDDLLNKRFEG